MVMSPAQHDETWNARFNAADLEGLMSLYEADGMLVEPGGKPLVGYDAMRGFLEGFFAMSPRIDLRTAAILALALVLPVIFLGIVPRELSSTAADISTVFPFAPSAPITVIFAESPSIW